MRWLGLTVFSVTLLQATEATAQEMQSIRTEAVLFVVIFSVMSIVSIVISKRQAKKYEQEKRSSKQDDEIKSEVVQVDMISRRVEELEKLVHEGVLTQEEFDILKSAKEMAQ
jgi:membrane protein implicated in regulation of membrane protease activity